MTNNSRIPEDSKPAKPSVHPDVPADGAARRDAELREMATPLVDAFLNIMGKLTPDGKRLVFVSGRGGRLQLYVSNTQQPEQEPLHLVPTGEQADSPVPTPDGKAVLFRSDRGANEHWRLYRVNLDGSDLRELTPDGELQRDTPLIPLDVPDKLFYSARHPSSAATTVYTQSALTSTQPEVLYTDQAPGELACISRDGRLGIFVRQNAIDDAQVLAIELATKHVRQLYPAPGAATRKVGIYGLHCTPDASRIYVATDGGGEDGLILLLDRETGKERARYRETDPPTAQLQDVIVSANGQTLAVKVNAGNQHVIKILDGQSLRLRAVAKLPVGMGFLGSISDDGKLVAVEWTTPSSPNDIYGVDTANGAVSPLRREFRPSLAKLPTVDVRLETVPSFDGLKVPVNIYLPEGAATSGKRLPVVVWIHGGPAANSTVRWKAQFRFLLSLGYAIVEPNVRGSTGFGRAYAMADDLHKRPDSVRDLEEVALWIGRQPWADKDRLVAMGLSYGGYMVLMALTRQPKLWRAGVDLFGFANMRTNIESTSGYIREVLKAEYGDPEQDGAFLDSISPIYDISKIVAPLFVYAGANDLRVPRSESDQIVAALRARKSVVEYMVAENEGHSLNLRETQLTFISRVARFLEYHLR
ncbi:MAG: prolyl oligopeptidase family serine peptidase [Polyangia bacterium]